MRRIMWLAVVVASALGTPSSPAAAQAFAEWVRPAAPVEAFGTSGVRGSVALVPTGIGDFSLRGSVVPEDRRLTWSLVPGSCTAASSPGAHVRPVLAEATPPLSGNWQVFDRRVPRGWTEGALALVGHAGDRATPLACADLPVAAARAHEPESGTPPGMSPLKPAPGHALDGAVRLSATPSGDFFLLAELRNPPTGVGSRADGSPNLLWSVSEGSCAGHVAARDGRPLLVTDVAVYTVHTDAPGEPRRERARRSARVLARGLPPVVDPGGRVTVGAVVPREWPFRTAEGELSLSAHVDGGGPLVACADLPMRAVLGPAAPASWSELLPRAGGLPSSTVPAGLAASAAAFALSGTCGYVTAR